MRYRHIIAVILAAAALGSCGDKVKVDPAFIAEDRVSLRIGGDPVFSYDETTCQMSFNRQRGQFCVNTDNMSDFFMVTVDAIPSEVGQKVTGEVVWSTPNAGNRTRSNVALKAVKLEGGKVWLWDSNDGVMAIVCILD